MHPLLGIPQRGSFSFPFQSLWSQRCSQRLGVGKPPLKWVLTGHPRFLERGSLNRTEDATIADETVTTLPLAHPLLG